MRIKKVLFASLFALSLSSCDGFLSTGVNPFNTNSQTETGNQNSQSEPQNQEENTGENEPQNPENPSEPEQKEEIQEIVYTYKLAKSTSDFSDGDKIIFVNSNKGKAAGLISTTFMSSVNVNIENDEISELPTNVLEFEVGVSNGIYSFKNGNNYLTSTMVRNVKLNSTPAYWSVSIVGDLAEIKSTANGYLLNNVPNSRFTTYSSISTTCVKPSIYVKTSSVPVYAKSLTLSGESTLYVGNQANYSVTFSPKETNKRSLIWESSNKEVLSVSNGAVKALKAGKTTLSVKAQSKEGVYDVVASKEIEVKNVNVTNVTLSETSKKIKVGKEFTLRTNVLPSNATNKNVTFTSSKPSVASVLSNGIVKGLAAGTSEIKVTTEDGNFTATCNVEVSDQILDDYTILIYMCGSDLEGGYDKQSRSYYYLSTEDLNEILSVSGQPDSVNIVIQTGGSKNWSSSLGVTNYRRYHVEEQKLVLDATLPTSYMSEQSTFEGFLEYGLTNYPAEKTGVILWNHGGALEGCCYDEYTNDYLSPVELNSGLKNTFAKLNMTEKLERIGYDCCLMQVQDIAEKNSTYFNYQIAAEESESGEGWDYDNWLPTLYKNVDVTTPVLGKTIADSFVSSFTEMYGSYYTNQETLSVIDLNKIGAYKDAFETMVKKLNITSSSKWSSLSSILKSCEKYAYESGAAQFDTFDAGQFLTKLSTNSTFSSASSYVNTALNAYKEAVAYYKNGSGHKSSTGLALFAPVYGAMEKSTYSSSITNFTNWKNVSINYGSWYQSGYDYY